uniref:Uncharacterized protein n=1 Tax=Arundo donax TaxID=35708 RepID=A0A0A9IWT0_ARUDO
MFFSLIRFFQYFLLYVISALFCRNALCVGNPFTGIQFVTSFDVDGVWFICNISGSFFCFIHAISFLNCILIINCFTSTTCNGS